MSSSDTGKGGDTGRGSIIDAGGSMGKRGQVLEEQYFRKIQAEQLKSLKESHEYEIKFHEEAIKHHKDKLRKHKLLLDDTLDD